ncbi:probable cyclin-dependent serine/threonine-protein kinase DDB_G0292550 [Sabethes cyaneus]|uniref:probable cyclin-dependent serine/threonine-protein kinase DDB_G0292550 n=1 Tax=Sabethes cyaneus TaxID=53552 RepID=UPI00237E68C9|nr:probable cyclin-dependent serine/threonine-protein kinase DDB_G0292550 [Sabethes cyaneus]
MQKSYDRNWEKWEKFREKKMQMMKVHKYNVEQRLRNENQERVYYRHHFNYHPVKRPKRKTSLDPNWYTENIYSNQSIDNSDGEQTLAMVQSFRPGKSQADRDINGNLDDGEIFTIGAQIERTNNYPKSNSCCFGGTSSLAINNVRCKIPKSHSFSTSRSMGAGFNANKYYNRNCFEMVEFPGHALSDSGRLNYYNGIQPLGMRICDREGCFNETCFSKDTKNIHNSNNNNLMNEWNQRNRNNISRRLARARPQHVMEEDFDLFEDDEENDLLMYNDDNSIVFDEFDDQDYYGAGPLAGDFNEFYRHERSKQLLRGKFDRVRKYTDDFTDDYHKSFEDIFNQNCYIDQQYQVKGNNFFSKPYIAKNKSMLEVKPPSKFDDTSSDSTDLELDDFNFDFEKYWEELEKPSPTSPSECIEKYPPGALKKVKNVNINRYNNGTVIDIYHDDDPYHSDHYHYREGNEKNNNMNIFSPPSLSKFSRKVHHERNNVGNGLSKNRTNKRNNINNNSNAISFLNNIFSIYKPSKYSPLNCHVEQNYLKNIPAKKMNITNSARTLGAPCSDNENSAKRPLTVHPSKQYSQRSYQSQRSQKEPQARFQIIPDKTGLKISPLYVSSADYRKARHKLKSTTRPLSFW